MNYRIERIFCEKCQGLQELRVNGEKSNHWLEKMHLIACNCEKNERKENMSKNTKGINEIVCEKCQYIKSLELDGTEIDRLDWHEYGYHADVMCVCNETEKDEVETRETILLGNGDILYIDGVCEDDENFYHCSYKSPKTGTDIPKVKVPARPCVKSDKEGITFECLPAVRREEKEAEKYKELASLNFGVDYSGVDVWIDVKKVGLVKVAKTTAKSVHFVDQDGKKRYTAAKNVKSIYNYSPEKEIPSAKDQKEQKKKVTKKKGADTKKKVASKSEKVVDANVVKTGNVEYIQEVPREADYRDRQVFIDIDENKKGMKVRRSHGGRVFWDNLETGQYSAISLKKVNSNESIVVYEYK